jgi:hypothetical protein
MSYDLCARKDKKFSGAVSREESARFISGFPNVVANGPEGFVMQRGNELYMEIDLSTVSEEGDVMIDVDNKPSPTINCIYFHVPYAYTRELETCRAVAFQIAQKLEWALYDPQKDAVIGGVE